MNWLFIVKSGPSGTDSVLRALATALRSFGDSVEEFSIGSPTRVSHPSPSRWAWADVVHFLSAEALVALYDEIDEKPFGVTIHGWEGPAGERWYLDTLRRTAPQWIHVMSHYTHEHLGRHRIASFVTGQPVDVSWFSPLPTPAEPVVGYFGTQPHFKGFDIVESICRVAGVRCAGHPIDTGRDCLYGDDLLAYYASISVYAQAPFGGCGTVPAQEALACGRPVLTTAIEPMRSIIVPRRNGELFDGSVRDGARRLLEIIDTYPAYAQGALETRLPDPRFIAVAFKDAILERM